MRTQPPILSSSSTYLYIYLYLFVAIIVMIDVLLVNPLEKILFQKLFPNSQFVLRPTCTQILPQTHKDSFHCLGMPSGHAEAVALASVLILAYIDRSPITICILLLANIANAIQRVVSKRHTILQVIAGTVFGCLYAFLLISAHTKFDWFKQ